MILKNLFISVRVICVLMRSFFYFFITVEIRMVKYFQKVEYCSETNVGHEIRIEQKRENHYTNPTSFHKEGLMDTLAPAH